MQHSEDERVDLLIKEPGEDVPGFASKVDSSNPLAENPAFRQAFDGARVPLLRPEFSGDSDCCAVPGAPVPGAVPSFGLGRAESKQPEFEPQPGAATTVPSGEYTESVSKAFFRKIATERGIRPPATPEGPRPEPGAPGFVDGDEDEEEKFMLGNPEDQLEEGLKPLLPPELAEFAGMDEAEDWDDGGKSVLLGSLFIFLVSGAVIFFGIWMHLDTKTAPKPTPANAGSAQTVSQPLHGGRTATIHKPRAPPRPKRTAPLHIG